MTGAVGDENSIGLLAENGGTATFTGGSITTLGTNAPAVLSQAGEGGASITLSGGTTILTFGDGSHGLAVNGSGASLSATGIGVKTHGVAAFGAANGFGPEFSAGGAMTLTDANIVTFGQDAHAVVVSGPGSITTLGNGNVLATQGDGAIGIYATAGGVVTATG